MQTKLTAIQRRLLDAVRRRTDRGEPPPSYRELCSEFGWASTGTVRDHLKALARKGYLRLSQGRARAVYLSEGGAIAIPVPLVGTIAAGIPVQTEESTGPFIPVPSEWVRNGRFFAASVSGDSMNGAGVLNGDYVIAKVQAVASDGDMVIATIDGESTLKRLKKRGSRWLLTPENKRYRPISVPADAAIIQGIVIGVLRSIPPVADFDFRVQIRQH